MHIRQEEFLMEYVNLKLMESYLIEDMIIMLNSLNLSINVL